MSRLGDGRVLVIQLARLGDLCQTWPLVQRLQGQHSKGAISLAVDTELAPVAALMVGNQNVISLPLRELYRHSLMSVGAPLKRLRAIIDVSSSQLYSTVVNLNYNSLAAALCEIIPVETRRGPRWRDVVTGRVPDGPTAVLFESTRGQRRGKRHLSDIWGDYAEGSVHDFAPLQTGMAVAESRQSIITATGLNASSDFVVVAPGAGLAARCPSPEYWAEAVAAISNTHPILLVGTNTDKAGAERISRTVGSSNIHNLCGSTDLLQLAGLLSHARLVIGVDSGVLHFAAMLGTRCLGAYYGSMNFRETGPYGDGHCVIAPDNPDYPCHEAAMEAHPERFSKSIPACAVTAVASNLLNGMLPEATNGVSMFRSRTTETGLQWDRAPMEHNYSLAI